MTRAHTPAEKRKALRSFKQRGYVVQPKALQIVLDAFVDSDYIQFNEFLNNLFQHLSRPGATHDSIVTAAVAAEITARINSKEELGNTGVRTAQGAFEVIDAFNVPSWIPNTKNAAVQFVSTHGSIVGEPLSKANLFRYRYQLVLSKTLRNEQFTPPASTILAKGKARHLQLTAISSLEASSEEQLVLGMLTQLVEGSWYLEDLRGHIKLDLSEVDTTAGLYTENCFVIAQGRYIETESRKPVFKVSVMGMPPREQREDSLSIVGKSSNLFGGNLDNSDMKAMFKRETEEKSAMILILSDIHLDSPRIVQSFRHILDGYLEDKVVPKVIVLMGSFLSHSFGESSNDVQLLSSKFTELAQMIANDFQAIAQSSLFVIIPSLTDPGPGFVLPRPSMPSIITDGFVNTIGKDRVFLGSNPCRMRYMTQEIVLMREDMLHKMLRHCCVPPNMNETSLYAEHLVKSVLDQAHLIPLPLNSRPVVWNRDQALWLFPAPHVLVLSDCVPSYSCRYGETVGINPGSFSSEFSFIVYLPSERKAQLCSLTSERSPADKDEPETPPPISEDEDDENSDSDSGHSFHSLRARQRNLEPSDDEDENKRDQNIDLLLNVMEAKPLQETGPVIGESQTEPDENDANDVEMKL